MKHTDLASLKEEEIQALEDSIEEREELAEEVKAKAEEENKPV